MDTRIGKLDKGGMEHRREKEGVAQKNNGQDEEGKPDVGRDEYSGAKDDGWRTGPSTYIRLVRGQAGR